MGRLAGKIAVVTGVGPGNGSAIARTFAREGADLALATFVTPALEETVTAIKALGRRAIVIEGDVGRRETWERTAAAVRAEFGGVDIVVNNAAAGQWANVLEVSEEQWDATLRTNLKSVYFSFQTFIPEMIERGGGVFVNISSVNGLIANPSFVDYATSKSALHGLTRNVALDFGPRASAPVASRQARSFRRSGRLCWMTKRRARSVTITCWAAGASHRTSPMPRSSSPRTRLRSSPASSFRSTAASPSRRRKARSASRFAPAGAPIP